MKKQILGVNITTDAKKDILETVAAYLSEDAKKSALVIVTPNPEQLMYASTDPEFTKLLNRADIALPDGVGIVWAMKFLLGIPLVRISGIDFLSDLICLANKNHYTIGLVGGLEDVSGKALSSLQSSYVELHGWNEQVKTFASTKDIQSYPFQSLSRKIITSGTKIVFVGLGAPKQEEFIESLKKQLAKDDAGQVVLMAVGGSFDMIAGSIPRAPQWAQAIGLEWLYRLVKEPWRFKRQQALFRYMFLVGKKKFFYR